MGILKTLYTDVTTLLSSLTTSGGTVNVFKYVGHYNGQELENPNNFSFSTPAAFIRFNRIDWTHTKHRTPDQDTTREEDGECEIAVHIFIHDLRTDKDSFPDHLDLFQAVYYALLGLRSKSTEYGKFSSLTRVSEEDDSDFNNLRHWVMNFTCRLQETGISLSYVDGSPLELDIDLEILP